MSAIETMAILLFGLNVMQFVFWGKQVQRLVDKLMSRTYYDYQTAKSIGGPVQIVKQDDLGVPEDLRSMNEIAF